MWNKDYILIGNCEHKDIIKDLLSDSIEMEFNYGRVDKKRYYLYLDNNYIYNETLINMYSTISIRGKIINDKETILKIFKGENYEEPT